MKSSINITYFALVLLLNSCATQNLYRTEFHGNIVDIMHTENNYHHVIRKDDKISLSIWNHNDLSIGSVFNIYNSNEAFGKWVLVDSEGNVKLPKIGVFKIAGLNCPEAADTLQQLYKAHLVNPIIVVKVLNREVTVLGEVRTPGTYVLDKEKNTINEVIGKAQGFLSYSELKEVQLIRKGISYTLDLTQLNKQVLNTIIIESGDLINIPSKKGKAFHQKVPTLIPFASSVTALALVASLILK